MTTILIIFGVAAAGGAVLAVQRIRGADQPSLPLALVHGCLAAAGIALLLAAVMRGATGGYTYAALGLFGAAALGGFVLFAMHMMKKALPIPLVLIHAVAALAGFALLLLAALAVT
jgi:hypothetical protein